MKTSSSLIKFGVSLGFALIAFALPLAASAATVTVSMVDDAFSPQTITINAGDTVVWQNNGAMTHTVTSDTGVFDSGTIQPGASFAATFPSAVTYAYHCKFHGGAGGVGMAGTVVVLAANSANTTTTTNAAYYANPNANYYATTGTTAAVSSSNASVSSLAAQVQALLAQIKALQGAGTTYAPSASYAGTCPQIGRVLSLGSSGSDVSSLQQFLAANSSIYPEGTVSGYYGSLTQSAVERWQSANNIISYGTPATTGYGVVGPRTAAAIRLACSGGSGISTGNSTGVGTTGGGTVGGFIQVTPISGAAPLAVSITATVNTANSCTGASYTLDFGDGSPSQQILVQSGNCAQAARTFTHTYQSAGTYTVTLSSGSHQTTTTVTVSGSGSGSGTTSGQPYGTLTTFVTSGTAPLAVTFYVSCASGVAYDLIYGDGQELGGSGVSQSSCNGGLQSVSHTYTSAGNYTAQLVVFVHGSQGALISQPVAQQVISVAGTYSGSGFPPMVVSPNQGGNPSSFSVQFSAGSCQSYTLNWGDGTGGSSGPCSGAAGSYTHTYTQSGTYTVTLTRDSQTDTSTVTISS